MLNLFVNTAHAMANQPGGKAAAQQPSLLQGLAPFIIVIVIFYLLVFLPQRKEKKKRQNMLANLKAGDKVLTASGIFGTITKIEKDYIMVKVNDNNVQVKMVKSAVSAVLNSDNKNKNNKKDSK